MDRGMSVRAGAGSVTRRERCAVLSVFNAGRTHQTHPAEDLHTAQRFTLQVSDRGEMERLLFSARHETDTVRASSDSGNFYAAGCEFQSVLLKTSDIDIDSAL